MDDWIKVIILELWFNNLRRLQRLGWMLQISHKNSIDTNSEVVRRWIYYVFE
jgi:hypothetical protein